MTRSIPILTRALWRGTLVDEAILRQWLVSSGRRDAFEGFGHLLCELHLRAQVVGLVSDHCLSIPMTQQDLGDATGLTPVHVNRVVRRLREEGMLTISGGTLEVHDTAALQRACGFDPRYLHLRSGLRTG